MTFCGNVIELVEKKSLLDDTIEFEKYEKLEDNEKIEVFIEKSLLPELLEKELIIIDAAIGEVKGDKFGLLFFKKDDNVYG